jgi:hypothetical protein
MYNNWYHFVSDFEMEGTTSCMATNSVAIPSSTDGPNAKIGHNARTCPQVVYLYLQFHILSMRIFDIIYFLFG